MNGSFQELNCYVYHSAEGAVLDAVIWCLGPYVREDRHYGVFRIYLARGTRAFVRLWVGIDD